MRDIATVARPGLTVVIPDRDAPTLLADALRRSAEAALAAVDGARQVVVVVNGDADRDLLVACAAVHRRSNASTSGAARVPARNRAGPRTRALRLELPDQQRRDRSPRGGRELMSAARRRVLAIGSQIFSERRGRREETGFTDWYADGVGAPHLPRAAARRGARVPHLCASGGAALPHRPATSLRRRDAPATTRSTGRTWNGACAPGGRGYLVIFCAGSHAATASRDDGALLPRPELDASSQRNRLLFDARNRATRFGGDWLMRRICDLPYASQRQLAQPRIAAGVLRVRAARLAAWRPLARRPYCSTRAVAPSIWPRASFSYRLTPFAHGIATQIAVRYAVRGVPAAARRGPPHRRPAGASAARLRRRARHRRG